MPPLSDLIPVLAGSSATVWGCVSRSPPRAAATSRHIYRCRYATTGDLAPPASSSATIEGYISVPPTPLGTSPRAGRHLRHRRVASLGRLPNRRRVITSPCMVASGLLLRHRLGAASSGRLPTPSSSDHVSAVASSSAIIWIQQ